MNVLCWSRIKRHTTVTVVRKNIKPKVVIKARNALNKMLWTFKLHKPCYFHGAIPTEVLEQVFVWMDPSAIKTYRLICRHINQAVTSSAFARMNLAYIFHLHEDDDNFESLYPYSWPSWLPEHQLVFVKEYLTDVVVIDENTRCVANIQKGLPSALGHFVNLKQLTITRRREEPKWREGIPAEIGNLKGLTVLAFDGIEVNGPIPSFIGDLANLKVLELSHNCFTGPIPPFIGRLLDLRVLNLTYNKFEGDIPIELWNLSNLRRLDLRSTNRKGPIPPDIQKLRRLIDLDLGGNSFSGPIPEELWNLTSLISLILTDNQLTGTISPSIRNLHELKRLWLNWNSSPNS
ncbi:UNVERIFIED_CONTAM: hypothetical protein HDU68_010202 [Siphonaria sp. JEL0065]|nr:hypothetical protein HDU68_010202 [Siphonaria sp. JEL0065]